MPETAADNFLANMCVQDQCREPKLTEQIMQAIDNLQQKARDLGERATFIRDGLLGAPTIANEGVGPDVTPSGILPQYLSELDRVGRTLDAVYAIIREVADSV